MLLLRLFLASSTASAHTSCPQEARHPRHCWDRGGCGERYLYFLPGSVLVACAIFDKQPLSQPHIPSVWQTHHSQHLTKLSRSQGRDELFNGERPDFLISLRLLGKLRLQRGWSCSFPAQLLQIFSDNVWMGPVCPQYSHLSPNCVHREPSLTIAIVGT